MGRKEGEEGKRREGKGEKGKGGGGRGKKIIHWRLSVTLSHFLSIALTAALTTSSPLGCSSTSLVGKDYSRSMRACERAYVRACMRTTVSYALSLFHCISRCRYHAGLGNRIFPFFPVYSGFV